MNRLRLTLFVLLSTIALIAIALNVRAQSTTYLPLVSLAGDTPTATASIVPTIATSTPDIAATLTTEALISQLATLQAVVLTLGAGNPSATPDATLEALKLTVTALVPTDTPTPTNTSLPTATNTDVPTEVPSATPSPDVLATLFAGINATNTAIAILSATPTPTNSATPSETPTLLPTFTATATQTPDTAATIIAGVFATQTSVAATQTAQAIPGGTIPQVAQ